MQLDHGTPDPNEVVWLVVEDLSDAQGNGIRRNVYGLNDSGRALREVTILDPAGTPQFWCRSWTLETSGQKLNRLAQERTPAAHNVSSSTVDEFLNPSHNGDYTNDQATLYCSAGLIHVYEYNTSGDQTGELIKQGRTGTAYYVSASDYYGGSNENRKHLVTARYEYPTGRDQPHGRLADHHAVQLHVLDGDRHDRQAHRHAADRPERRERLGVGHHDRGVLR